MNITLPINFGHRPCDRLLVRNLTAKGFHDRTAILWMAFLVWQDFATAREDRRTVPEDPAALASSNAAGILEEFIGWKGEGGGFITAGIEAGFFMLTPVADGQAELILTDFYPANATASTINNSQLGGVNKSWRRVRETAAIAATDQLRLFEQSGGLVIEGVNDAEKKAALRLIHSICMTLKRQKPSDETWKETLIGKAVEVIRATTEEERECVCKWFIKNREDQRIPLRLDFVLDQFREFVAEATQMFRRVA